MIIRLLPSQITEHWDCIREGVMASLPPTYCSDPNVSLYRVQQSLMVGNMDCWLVCGEVEEETTGTEVEKAGVKAMMVTTILFDEFSGGSTLLLYSLYGMGGGLTKDLLREAWVTLCRYGKQMGCAKLAFYTLNPTFAGFMERLGGNVQQYCSLDLDTVRDD